MKEILIIVFYISAILVMITIFICNILMRKEQKKIAEKQKYYWDNQIKMLVDEYKEKQNKKVRKPRKGREEKNNV